MEVQSTFLTGRMNKDLDPRILTDYRHAENIRVASSEAGNVGSVEKCLSNRQMTFLDMGDNVKTIGSLEDEFDRILYYLVKSDSGCYVVEYKVDTETATFVLQDTLNVLDFNENYLAEMALIVNTDNGDRLLVFTDNHTQPKCINVERAKTYTVDGFTEDMILLIKKPPLDAPTISLDVTTSNDENNIEEKFIYFAYRYKYLDGEYSSLSPFSEVAFLPNTFNYDYSTGTNKSMINKFNKAVVTFNTGSAQVTDIEVVFKESGMNSVYVIGELNKALSGWSNNVPQTFTYINSKVFKVLPEKELFRLYDNVPLLAGAMTVIDNRIVFGNYTENYNLINDEDDKVNVDFALELEATAIADNTATPSLKSNRDYEVGMGYVDDYGRMTTVLVSKTNTLAIPPQNCVTENKISAIVQHKAPAWAKKFRFFIKQTKGDYESISPVIFYQDGAYRWFRLEQADKDKIKEGDFLIVKSDSSGVLNSLVKVKVLEVSHKDKNFLQPEDVIDRIIEKSGLYFKIKPEGFRINSDDFENFNLETYHNSSSNYNNPVRDTTPFIDTAHFYGSGLNDMVTGGACTLGNNTDKRYAVKIDAAGTPDAFKWSEDGGSNWSVAVNITGAAQPLADGVTITFAATTGHTGGDEWDFYIRGAVNTDDAKAYGFFRIKGELNDLMSVVGDTIQDEIIENGASLTLVYDEYNRGDVKWQLDEISTGRYDNIIEWFYKEGIAQKITTASPGFNLTRIRFVRGMLAKDPDGSATRIEQSADGYMTMVMESQNSETLSELVKLRTTTTLFQSDGSTSLVFETDPVDENTDIFFELGKTYDIDVNGYHLGDVNQNLTTPGEFILEASNCFAWGNAFESYKLRDAFNAKTMKLDTRPSTTIDDYRQNKRISSFTYSNNYEQTTNYNALNEFNLGMANYKILDDKFGSIRKIIEKNGDLEIWFDDKVMRCLYKKSITYNKDGTSTMNISDDTFSDADPFEGEYGISTNAEGFARYGNYEYWPDRKRGVVLRKGRSGIEVISNFGMSDWFRDNLVDGKILGGYDPYFDTYVINLNGYTLAFDEKVKGWVGFYSYLPDSMRRISNRFYTIKDGQVFLHNAVNNGINNFYGVQYDSVVTPVLKLKELKEIIFKTIKQQSLLPWSVVITTNLTQGTVDSTEFEQDESYWETYFRKNEDDLDMNAAQGIGVPTNVTGKVFTFNSIPSSTSVGDELCSFLNDKLTLIGVISNKTATQLTVTAILNAYVQGAFILSKKDARIEGSEIRGIYAEIQLTDSSTDENKLFSVSSEVILS